jgi:ABC-2 type transport system ATP-binding protein
MIQVIDFRKSYRETLAVRGLSFSVQPGEVLGLVGPNGAGKTSTLRALAGIIPPSAGQLLIAGCDIINDPVNAKRNLAYIPDDPRLFEALTVWEHLQFIASTYNVSNHQQRAQTLLAQFDLTEKRNTPAQELSRGMRQKVAICCAYLHRPPAILFDEPMTGLDPRGIRTLKDSIAEHAHNGASIIVSSHLLALVEGLCSHLLILHRGESLFCGRIADARAAFAGMTDATLEEVFFRATEGHLAGGNGDSNASPSPAHS